MLDFPYRNGHGGGPRDPRPPVLTAEAISPVYRLTLVLKAEERAREEWEEACRIEADIDPQADPDGLEAARKQIRNAYRRWFEISQQATDLSERVRKHALEPTSENSKLIDELKSQFDGGGPHYDLLCERVAGLHSRLKAMEASGRDFSPAEHATLNNQLLGYINQLQKYTESMKSESISRETRDAVEEVLRIVERHLGTTYLEVWHVIVKDVRHALEESAA